MITDRLALARSIVAGEIELPGADPARAACLLARQELECVVDTLLSERGLGGGRVPMRTRLICLGQAYADDEAISAAATAAWVRLSSACHHHAYELAPSSAEAARLITLVADLRGHGR